MGMTQYILFSKKFINQYLSIFRLICELLKTSQPHVNDAQIYPDGTYDFIKDGVILSKGIGWLVFNLFPINFF